jgi:hypothetical protein
MMDPVPENWSRGKKLWKRCGLPAFCEFCGYVKGQDNLKKYAMAWMPLAWHSLTLSTAGFIRFDPGGETDVLELWDGNRGILGNLKKHVQGYFGWEELAVRSFYPEVLVSAHTHVNVFDQAGVDLDLLQRLALAEMEARPGMPDVNILIEPDLQEGHFLSCAKYIGQMDVSIPYREGHHMASEAGELELFHQNVQEFYHGYCMLITEYREIKVRKKRRKELRPFVRSPYVYAGTCHGSSRACVATSRHVRGTKAHQEDVRQLTAEVWEDEADAADPV